MADQIQLSLDVKANIESAVSGLNDLNNTVKRVATSTLGLGNAFSSLKSAILPVLAAFSFKKIIDQGERLDDVFKKIGQLSKQTGISFKAIENAANSLSQDGLIPLEDSITSLRNLLRTGMSLDQARKLLNAFRESAALGSKDGTSLGESIKNASEAFLTGNTRVLKSIGIYINANEAQREYAKSLGKTEKQLTATEKRQALYNATIQQASQFTGDYALIQEDFGTKLKTIQNELFLAAGSIGMFITNSKSSAEALDTVISSLRTFNTWIKGIISDFESLANGFEKAKNAAIDFFTTLDSYRPSNLGLKLAKEIQDIKNKLSGSEPIDILKVDPTKNRAARDQLLKEIDFIANKGKEKVVSIPNDILGSLEATASKQLQNLDKEFSQLSKNFKQNRPEVSDAFIAEFEKVKTALKNSGNSELAIVKTQYDERNKIIQEALTLEYINDKQAKALILQNSKKLFEDEKKARDEAIKRQKEAIDRNFTESEKKPIKILIENVFPNLAKKSKEVLSAAEQTAEEARARITGSLSGFLTFLKGGAEGAKNFLADTVGGFAESYFGEGAGKVVGGFVQALSGSKDEVRKQIDGFFQQIPVLIENIITNLPLFFERMIVGFLGVFRTLSERFPEIIMGFINGVIDSLPIIIDSVITFLPNIFRNIISGIPRLIRSLADAMPQVATSFASALIGEAPAIGAAVANAIVNALGGKLKKFGQGAGNFFSDVYNKGAGNFFSDVYNKGEGFVSDVASSLGFARGGELNGGTPFRDSIPVMAQQGELFVDRGTTNKLKNYLDQNDSSMKNDLMMSKLLNAFSAPQTIETEVRLDNDAFANIILKLNRKNMRLA